MLHTIRITPDWFNHLRSFKEFQELLCDLDIADEDQLDLFDTLDVDGSGVVDLEELVVGIRKLRGDARRSDIVGVGLVVRNIQTALMHFEEGMVRLMEEQKQLLTNMSHKSILDSRLTRQSASVKS